MQRADLEILDASSTATPTADQRKAAASCSIDCDGANVGTLHAMPLFYQHDRGAPLAGAAGSNGIISELHFIKGKAAPKEGSACAKCTDFKFIQVITTNASVDARGNEFVDNNSGSTPFYDDAWMHRSGKHVIPANFPDAGNTVTTTKSIYDKPGRTDSHLTAMQGKDFTWNAESHVVCIRPSTDDKSKGDKILGGLTYGFTRAWDGAKKTHGDAQAVSPSCVGAPSAQFTKILKGDKSVSGYKFET